MKPLVLILMSACTVAMAAGAPLDRMFDTRLTVSQRNDACFELRGQKDAATSAAMLRALKLEELRSCASSNLRVAGAIDELRQALASEAPEIRATAARELGSFEKSELLEPLAQAAADPNLLVATNALYALNQYRDPAVWPYLEALAGKGGIVGIMALDRIHELHDPQALAIARKVLDHREVPDRVAAMRVIGEAGDSSDLPRLQAIAAKPEEVMVRQRGFGLMPAIDVSKAARATITQIQARMAHACSMLASPCEQLVP
jgi:HEAT repeat protein